MSEETKPARTCANCACYQLRTEQNQTQAFCRRNTPLAQMVRVEMAVIRDGHPVIDKQTGKPATRPGEQLMYLYPPTQESMVCFDGWRPADTLPGDRWEINLSMKPLMDGFHRLMGDLVADASRMPIDDFTKKN